MSTDVIEPTAEDVEQFFIDDAVASGAIGYIVEISGSQYTSLRSGLLPKSGIVDPGDGCELANYLILTLKDYTEQTKSTTNHAITAFVEQETYAMGDNYQRQIGFCMGWLAAEGNRVRIRVVPVEEALEVVRKNVDAWERRDPFRPR